MAVLNLDQSLGRSLVPSDLYGDPTRRIQVDAILHPLQFDIGKYGITANHYASKTTESIQFEIVTAQSEILSIPETQGPLTMEICSSTAHHETIKKDL